MSALAFSWATYIIESFLLVPFFFGSFFFGCSLTFCDFSERAKSNRLCGDGAAIANSIRQRIKDELGLTVSIGVSFNKIFAKLGSDMKKPDTATGLWKSS